MTDEATGIPRIPSPPEKIDDPEWQSRFGDVVAVSKIETLQSKTKYLMTLGYVGIDTPTKPDQETEKYHTLLVDDYKRLTSEEIVDAIFLPAADDMKLTRRFAVEFHNLIAHSFQLVDITQDTFEDINILLMSEAIENPEDVLRIISLVRELLSGKLIIQHPSTTKRAVTELFKNRQKSVS